MCALIVLSCCFAHPDLVGVALAQLVAVGAAERAGASEGHNNNMVITININIKLFIASMVNIIINNNINR